MAARVIHFGQDDCHRLMVLRSAGYSVDDCGSLMQLRARLATGASAEALLMSDAGGVEPDEAIALARTRSSLPVILFRSTNLAYEETGVDLIVPCLTPPEIWLDEVEALIAKSRIVSAKPEGLRDPSAPPCRESSDAIERSQFDRVRSKRELARNIRFSANQALFPGSGSK